MALLHYFQLSTLNRYEAVRAQGKLGHAERWRKAEDQARPVQGSWV